MAFVENVSAYFDTSSGFALDATFDAAGVNRAVKVIFDQPYLTQDGIGGSNPTAQGLPADFPFGSTVGKTLLINAVTYIIRRRELEDDGVIVRLQLEAP